MVIDPVFLINFHERFRGYTFLNRSSYCSYRFSARLHSNLEDGIRNFHIMGVRYIDWNRDWYTIYPTYKKILVS